MVSWVKDVGNFTEPRTLQSINVNDSIFVQSISTRVKASNFSMEIADFAGAATSIVPLHPVITIDVRVGCFVLTIPMCPVLEKSR